MTTRIETIYLLVRRSGKDGGEKKLSSFSFSYFGTDPTTTATDAAPADDADAPAKDGFKEKAADETAGTDELFDALTTTADGGGGAWSKRLPRQSCCGVRTIQILDLTTNNDVAGKDEAGEEQE